MLKGKIVVRRNPRVPESESGFASTQVKQALALKKMEAIGSVEMTLAGKRIVSRFLTLWRESVQIGPDAETLKTSSTNFIPIFARKLQLLKMD